MPYGHRSKMLSKVVAFVFLMQTFLPTVAAHAQEAATNATSPATAVEAPAGSVQLESPSAESAGPTVDDTEAAQKTDVSAVDPVAEAEKPRFNPEMAKSTLIISSNLYAN